ncbi:MAG TPA: hypothetical protein VLB76_07575 [Thermoanaerobaculia bacterium]|jgi:hypothetical protein|nr:hypothetical protein [Thermoanaerobaculia bacterium]
MRKQHLSLIFWLTFALLAVIVPAFAARARFSSASFIPPAEAGQIFVVINYDRAGGRTQPTGINVDWGRASRRITVSPPYRLCAQTPASGIVLKMRHPRPDQVPMTVTTTGTIVRGPYQGEPPLELVSACYRLK